MDKKDQAHPVYKRIKEAMGTKTDKQLAERLGVSQQAVNRWKKKGEVKPTRLKTISDLTGVSYPWLLTGEGEKFPRKSLPGPEQFTVQEREALLRVALSPTVQPMRSLSIVAELKDNQLYPTTKDRAMNIPQNVSSETALVIEVIDDRWKGEGFNQGDALIVEPVNGADPNGKMVVAQFGDQVIIRRFEQQGGFAYFPATLNGGHDFKIPINDLQISYIVKSVVCAA